MPVCLACKEANVLEVDELCPHCTEVYKGIPVIESDGGPAFPMPSASEPRQNETTHYNEGMSLRAWFAGVALQGLLGNLHFLQTTTAMILDTLDEEEQVPKATQELIAKIAVNHADALLAELSKPKDGGLAISHPAQKDSNQGKVNHEVQNM